ncbi:hypothetical protein JOB18_014382 [Solea senegalensis]|uniref:Uncharacterized protein n=1 Tax=Solea senegalensis TaxID=28829 RepID=A0AAV6QHL8_SOLSE|nr:hypothetical protein JOB18_014382 [Solea senegalensis]
MYTKSDRRDFDSDENTRGYWSRVPMKEKRHEREKTLIITYLLRLVTVKNDTFIRWSRSANHNAIKINHNDINFCKILPSETPLDCCRQV